MASKKHEKAMEQERIQKELLGCLEDLRQYCLTEEDGSTSSLRQRLTYKWSVLRSVYCPYDTDEIFHHDDFDYNNYNTNIIHSPLKATSGFMSYHYSPRDKFFSLDSIDYRNINKKKRNVDEDKVLADRVEDSHSILQEAHNFSVLTQCQRDKIVFGVCCMTVDEDETKVAQLSYYPPEAIIYGSSNGQRSDIYGVKERMTGFQLRERFPERVTNFDFRTAGMIETESYLCYRVNIPKMVFWNHVSSKMKLDREENKKLKKELSSLLKISSVKKDNQANPWLDIWFSDEGVLTIDEREYHSVVVGPFALGTQSVSLGKGLGEINLPTALFLTEMEVINFGAYEKTYSPAWAVHEESQQLGLDLGRDGLTIYGGDNRTLPQHMSLGANVQGMMEFNTFIEARHAQGFYLPMFEILNKSRMTKSEVELRRPGNLRQALLYVIVDEKYFLNPTVKAINSIINSKLEGKVKKSKGFQTLITSRFVSPLAMANRTNIIEMQQDLLEYYAMVGKVEQEAPMIKNYVDLGEGIKEVTSKTGNETLLHNSATIEKNLEREQELEKQKINAAKADAFSKLQPGIKHLTENAGGGSLGGNESPQPNPGIPQAAPPQP